MKPAEANAIAGVVAVAAGYLAYASASKPPPCAGIDGQTLGQAIAGARSHTLEDFVEGAFGFLDLDVSLSSFGLITPTWSADFYKWYHNLTPDQAAAVQQAADSGADACAAIETTGQVKAGLDGLITAAIVGVGAYLLVPILLEAK
jgi:hypothetical protein